MDDTTRKMVMTIGAGLIKKSLLGLGATLATHGVISSNQTETFVAVGMALVGVAWSLWNDYGRAIVLSQLDVLKAKSLAQAAKMRDAGVTPVTVSQVAAQSPTLTTADVSKTVATLPAEVQKNVVKMIVLVAAAALLLAMVSPDAARAQLKKPQITGNVIDDAKVNLGINPPSTSTAAAPAGSVDAAIGNFNSGIQKLTKDLVDKAISDVTAAQTDAQNHNDQISKPCWDANLALLKSLPSQWETPPSLIGIALGIQIQRDLLNAITGNEATSLKVACAALWGDQLRIVGNLGALLGIRIATGGLL